MKKKTRNSNRHFIKSVWIKQILNFRFVLIHLAIDQLKTVFKVILRTDCLIGWDPQPSEPESSNLQNQFEKQPE